MKSVSLNKTLYLFILLCFSSTASATKVLTGFYDNYKNCDGYDLSLASIAHRKKQIETMGGFKKKGYDFETIFYYLSTKVDGHPIQVEECLTIDNKRKEVLYSSARRDAYCDMGHWKQESDHPIWVVDNDDGGYEQEFIPSFKYKKLLDTNSSDISAKSKELKEIYSRFECSYKPYKKSDVEEINNTAFYLYKLGELKKSIALLNIVISLDSSRTVTYFNIGDVYLALNQKDLAIQNYKKYIQLMQEKGLSNKIPKGVLDIVKSK